jgi:hypothetical protein
MKTLPFLTTQNIETGFRAAKAAAFAAGLKYEIEVGNCSLSDFAWFGTEAEARDAKPLLDQAWSNEDEVGTVEFDAIRLLGTDEDGDHDETLDEEI